jgi:wyosine [tRNA(Phe)-imidazoG37] synthetase (radical SAM superfamily)
MRWQKGQSGNPSGRPRGLKSKYSRELEAAIENVEKSKDQKLLVRAVEMAYEDSRMMIAILKKILPDTRYVEADVRSGHDDWVKLLEEEALESVGNGLNLFEGK